MARDVRVHIDKAALVTALTAPGGIVNNWSEVTGRKIVSQATRTSPVNNPLNALHRGGVVGTYKASWGFDMSGTNQYRTRVKVYNTADHAHWVEHGRDRSHGYEVFTWQHAYHLDAIHGGATSTPGGHRWSRGTARAGGKAITRCAMPSTL